MAHESTSSKTTSTSISTLAVPSSSNSRDAPPSPEPEDWDRSLLLLPTPPASPETAVIAPSRSSSRRSLSEVMKMQARKSLGSKDVDVEIEIDEEEGKRVAEELGEWINADASPFESPSDSFFARQESSYSPANHGALPDGKPVLGDDKKDS